MISLRMNNFYRLSMIVGQMQSLTIERNYSLSPHPERRPNELSHSFSEFHILSCFNLIVNDKIE
jgi:hypothetical protein